MQNRSFDASNRKNMPFSLFNAKHWHDRAEEARAMSKQMTHTETKGIMERIAKGYDEMARRAERAEDLEKQDKLRD